jgi:homospermidine synthase
MKVNIKNKKILFLGYGAVAKCVLNYFDNYFEYDIAKMYVVDKCQLSFYGPFIDKINKNNKIILNVTVLTFKSLIKQINLKEGDIIIDLTFFSSTYYFIHECLINGFNYINTSIEDDTDQLFGSSIDFQQQTINKIYNDFIKNNKIKSNILTEFGQNPGLIQHYILYALNNLNKLHNNTTKDDYNITTLSKVIDNYKIGTIFVSEIDNLIKKKESKIENKKDNTIYNTWSVAGLLGEGFDKTEFACGKNNKYIKPTVLENTIDINKMNIVKNNNYDVYFLQDIGINTYINSICPIVDNNDQLLFKKYNGMMIHHGEVFELAKLFGKNAPFMSYVYKINKYAEKSIKKFMKNRNSIDEADIQHWVLNNCKSFHVFDNINKKNNDKIIGHDSIGCTIYCGDKSIEKIYWCGSILGDRDKNVNPLFTPTIIQVAAGVLSGLSYMMESKNKNKGLLNPCDLDTKYILDKSIPLLGKFFFTEIPTSKFDKKFNLKIKNF